MIVTFCAIFSFFKIQKNVFKGFHKVDEIQIKTNVLQIIKEKFQECFLKNENAALKETYIDVQRDKLQLVHKISD